MRELVIKKTKPIIESIVMVLAGILPILAPYGSTYSIATILSFAIGVFLVACLPFYFKKQSLVLCIPLFVILVLLLRGFSLSIFATWVLVLIVCLLFLSNNFKPTLIVKTIKYCSVVCSIVIVLQTAVHYIFGYHIPFIASNLIMPQLEGTYWELIDTGIGTHNLYRPSALFLEPAAFAQYCGVGLIMFMFSKQNRKNICLEILVSLGIILTTSGIGIVIVAVSWLVFFAMMIYKAKFKQKLLLLGILVAIASIAVLLYFFVGPLKTAIDRIMSGEGITGRSQAWKIYWPGFSAIEKIFGRGASSLPQNTYLTGIFEGIWSVGIIGVIALYTFIFISGIRLSYKSLFLAVLFTTLQLFANNINIPFLMFLTFAIFSDLSVNESHSSVPAVGKSKVKQFKKLMHNFGFGYTFKTAFFKLIKSDEFYVKTVKKYLLKNLSLFDFEVQNSNEIEKKIIWTFWWQGLENLPELVKVCYLSHINNIDSNEFEYVFITKDNYQQYVSIPQNILDKVNNGTMSLTHLSDYLRVALLEKYGGMWLDITVFVSQKLPLEYFNYKFFSVKTGSVPDNLGQVISENKWSGFLLATNQQHSFVFQYLKHALEEYWEKYDYVCEYFLMNTLLSIGYYHFDSIKKDIDEYPVNNSKLSELRKSFSKPLDLDSMEKTLQEEPFFKMTLKLKFSTEIDGNKTNFGWFMEKYSNDSK